MPATITRTAWTDDDGSGTSGTVINNAEKTALYDQIDGALEDVAEVTVALTTHGVVIASAADGVKSTAVGTAGQVLTSNGAGVDPTFQGGVVALTDGATPALDASLGSVFTLAAAGDRTIAVPSNPTNGQKIIIRHLASGGARTLALNTGAGGFRFGTDVTALTETASGKTDYIGAIYSAIDSRWDVVAVTKGF